MVKNRELPDKSHDEFNEEIRARNLYGHWMLPGRREGYREPTPSYSPFLWEWQGLRRSLYEAVDNLSPEDVFRRFIGCQHPEITLGTSPNLIVGAQLILAGEFAPPHRHTMDAVRFVIEGDGKACTIVEGEEFPMARGDLITTPNWSWHEHINASERDAIWVDCAVAPLVRAFNIGFSEPHQAPHQERTAGTDWSRHQFGPLHPRQPVYSTTSRRPPYRYPWTDALRTLDVLEGTAGDPCDDLVIHYADPVTGGPTLPTIDCELFRLRPDFKGGHERHTHAEILHVLDGSGRTCIGADTLDWKQGDTFVVPLWTWHAHENNSGSPATLLSVTDKPVMQSLGFDRQERAPSQSDGWRARSLSVLSP